MLRISKLTDYATVILAALCERPDTVLSAAGLAERTHVGLPTVSKLLKELQRAGLVRSVRGAHGGYQLAREPARISAADIIDAVEGPVALTECSSDRGHCGIEATCQVGHSWQQVSRSIHRALSEVPLTTLVRHDATVRAPDLRPGLTAEWRPLTRL
jgi:FeS assembly SUF system regulator